MNARSMVSALFRGKAFMNSPFPTSNAALERLADSTTVKDYSPTSPLQALVMLRVGPNYLRYQNRSNLLFDGTLCETRLSTFPFSSVGGRLDGDDYFIAD